LPANEIQRGLGGAALSNELVVKLRLAGGDTLPSEVRFSSSVSDMSGYGPESMLQVWAMFFNLKIDKTCFICTKSLRVMTRVASTVSPSRIEGTQTYLCPCLKGVVQISSQINLVDIHLSYQWKNLNSYQVSAQKLSKAKITNQCTLQWRMKTSINSGPSCLQSLLVTATNSLGVVGHKN
jgi:hypothetical protein